MGRKVFWSVSIVSNAGAEGADITLGAPGLWLVHEANILRTAGSNGTGLTQSIYREGGGYDAGKAWRYSATATGGVYNMLRGPASGAGSAGQPVLVYTSTGTIRQRVDISGANGDTYTFSGIAEYIGPCSTASATEV